tara:strand:- start:422 stop:709 length:288 start_codon:yes stop_codon:yes gene_type:complete
MNPSIKDKTDVFHLLANPIHIKGKRNKPTIDNIDNDIFILLNKRFPSMNITEYDRQNILEKIESLLNEISIKNTINEVINNIISSLIIENEYRIL